MLVYFRVRIAPLLIGHYHVSSVSSWDRTYIDRSFVLSIWFQFLGPHLYQSTILLSVWVRVRVAPISIDHLSCQLEFSLSFWDRTFIDRSFTLCSVWVSSVDRTYTIGCIFVFSFSLVISVIAITSRLFKVISVIVTVSHMIQVFFVMATAFDLSSILGDFGHYSRVPSFTLDLGDTSLCTPCPHSFIFHPTFVYRWVISSFIHIYSCVPQWFSCYSTSTSIFKSLLETFLRESGSIVYL